MCGRYYRRGDKQKIAEAFHAKLVDDGTPSPPWDYNVAPTTIPGGHDAGTSTELMNAATAIYPLIPRMP